MALNPAALQGAFVATPFAANPWLNGLGFVPSEAGVPYFVKFFAVGGFTYVVGSNQLPGEIALFGPNGQPLNPGVAISQFSFTPQSSGLYLIEIVPSAATVAAHQEVTVNIDVTASGLTDPFQGGGLTPADQPFFNPAQGITGGVLSGSLPGGMVQYVLHAPDGNSHGLGTAAPAASSQTTTLPPPNQAGVTPLEMPPVGEVGDPTQPITWAGATDAGTGGPIQISISPAASNYVSDSSLAVGFDNLLTPQDYNLLVAAANLWELLANVHFNFVPDVPDGSTQEPSDIRVGLADINAAIGKPGMTFVGDTEYNWDANNNFLPDNLVNIEDPNETATTQLADGDQQYNGTTATMFQSMVHELGHALGLDHNPSDPNSIMNPTLSSQNPLPDDNDLEAIQSLYGAPTHSVVFASQADLTLLRNLVNGAGMTS